MTAFRSGIRTQDLNKSMLQSFKLNVLYWYIDYEYIPGMFFIPNTAYPHRTVMKLHVRTVNLLHNYLSIHITACKMTVLLIDSMHYNDVTMGAIASQITSLTIVHSNVIQTQIKENIKAPHHWPLFAGNSPVNSRTNGQLRGNFFPFDDVIIDYINTFTILCSPRRSSSRHRVPYIADATKRTGNREQTSQIYIWIGNLQCYASTIVKGCAKTRVDWLSISEEQTSPRRGCYGRTILIVCLWEICLT